MHDLERPVVPNLISELAEVGWQRVGPQAGPLPIGITYRFYSRMRAVELTAHRFAPHLPVHLGLHCVGSRGDWEIAGPSSHAAAFTAAARAAEADDDPDADAAQALAVAGWLVAAHHTADDTRARGRLYTSPGGTVAAERIARSRHVADSEDMRHWVIRHSGTPEPAVAHPATPGAVLVAYLLTLTAT